jgi:hypothetical protein
MLLTEEQGTDDQDMDRNSGENGDDAILPELFL